MPSYLRARRESAVSGTETAVVAGRRSANRPWFGGLFAIRRVPVSQTTEQPQTGNLTIDTRPAISEVLVDGERRGMTPLTLSMKPGAHRITVRTGSEERVVPLMIAAGADVTQYFEM